MKKRILEMSCMLLLLVLMIAGCSNGKDSGEYKIYYLSMDMTKTIERMKTAHPGFFVVKGQSLYNRRNQHLNKTATGCIGHN